MRAIPLVLVTLLCVGLAPAQTPVLAAKATEAKKATKPGPAADALATLRASLKEVMAHGRLAEKPLIKLRRTQPVKAAVAVMRMVSKKLRKMEKPDPAPPAEKVMETCKAFSKHLGDFVKLADKGLAAASAAMGTAEGFEKDFLKKVHGRLYVQVAYAEITSYFVGNAAPGTFDGMFSKTEKLGREGAKAMLDLFADLDQPLNVRQLAGEGVAQLGKKEDAGAVTDVHDDQLEDPQLRRKAMFVLARLGDTAAFDKEVKKGNDAIKELESKRDEAEATFKKLADEHKELSKVEQPTDEQKSRLAKLQNELRDANRAFANMVFATGNAYLIKAQLYLELRDHKETETCYKTTLNNWMRIAGHLQNPQLRNRVNIAFYNLSCVQSLQGNVEPALKAIENAFKWGYRNYDWCLKDGDLTNVRKDKRFAALLEEVKSGKAMERWKKEAEAARKKAEEASKPKKPDGDS